MCKESPQRTSNRAGIALIVYISICVAGSWGCKKEEENTETTPVEIVTHPEMKWDATPLANPIPFQFQVTEPSPTTLLITETLEQKNPGDNASKMTVTTQREVTLTARDTSTLETDGTLHVPLQVSTARITMNPSPGDWEAKVAKQITNTQFEAVMGPASVWVETVGTPAPSIQTHVEQIAFNLGLILPSLRPQNDKSSKSWPDAMGWRQRDRKIGIQAQRKVEILGTSPCGIEKKETCSIVRIQIQLTADSALDTSIRPISTLSPTPDQWHVSMKGEGKGEATLLLSPKGGVPLRADMTYNFRGVISGTKNGQSVDPIEQYRTVRVTLYQKD